MYKISIENYKFIHLFRTSLVVLVLKLRISDSPGTLISKHRHFPQRINQRGVDRDSKKAGQLRGITREAASPFPPLEKRERSKNDSTLSLDNYMKARHKVSGHLSVASWTTNPGRRFSKACNSISITTYLFCRQVTACRVHSGGTPSRWYYCSARILVQTVPTSPERPLRDPAGRRASMGSVQRHSRSHCEQEASDDGEHTRTCPALYSRAIVLDLAEISFDGPGKIDQPAMRSLV